MRRVTSKHGNLPPTIVATATDSRSLSKGLWTTLQGADALISLSGCGWGAVAILQTISSAVVCIAAKASVKAVLVLVYTHDWSSDA